MLHALACTLLGMLNPTAPAAHEPPEPAVVVDPPRATIHVRSRQYQPGLVVDPPRAESLYRRPLGGPLASPDGSHGDWTPLFNGRDLTGWRIFTSDQVASVMTWRVADGRIICTGEPAGYIATEGTYQDFVLQLEWRWAGEPGNSGVLLRTIGPDKIWPSSLEAQLMHANAGDFWKIGEIEAKTDPDRTRASGRNCRKIVDAENPPGQWNRYTILCVEDTVSLYVNGRLVNGATGVSRRPGWICLQSEGAPIEFRNIRIRVLD